MKFLVSGIKKRALGDYPGLASITILLGGCSLNCKNCDYADFEEVEFEEIKSLLEKKEAESIFISGCEPLFNKDECDALARLAKKNDLKIGISTRGLAVENLKDLVENGLIDFIRLEICAPLDHEKYSKKINISAKMLESIKASIGFVRASGINYEFYTRLDNELPSGYIKEIYKQISPAKMYVLDIHDLDRDQIPKFMDFANNKTDVMLRFWNNSWRDL